MKMKKLFLMLFAAAFTVSASAQTVEESKTFDNWYIGLNGGLETKTTGHAWMGDLNPNIGLRIGRYMTPVFGFALESNMYLSNKPYPSIKTFVRSTNTSLLGTVNFSNWIGGYKGEPRFFEVSAVYGQTFTRTTSSLQRQVSTSPSTSARPRLGRCTSSRL